jgi:quercetin dioxygenase-like cupin family protein
MGMRASFITGVAVYVTVALGSYVVSAAGVHDQSSIPTPDAAARRNPMTVLALQSALEPGADKQVVSLFTGPRRTLVQITLRNSATLAAHKAAVPITIHCVAGSGTLTVSDQGAAVPLKPGVLVTLEPGVVHEIVAAPSVSVLLTQFTDQ